MQAPACEVEIVSIRSSTMPPLFLSGLGVETPLPAGYPPGPAIPQQKTWPVPASMPQLVNEPALRLEKTSAEPLKVTGCEDAGKFGVITTLPLPSWALWFAPQQRPLPNRSTTQLWS